MPRIIKIIWLLIFGICAIMLSPLLAQHYSYDVGVTAMISPPALMQPDVPYPVEVEVANFGRLSVTFSTVFRSYDIEAMNIVICDTLYTTLISGEVDTLSFDGLLSVHDEHDGFSNCAFTWLSGDQLPANDTLSSYSLYNSPNAVLVWYGNPNVDPVEAYINYEIPLDVYFQGPLNGNIVSELCFALRANTQYIDELLGVQSGSLYYPLTAWNVAYFTDQYGSPPNPDGWIGQSVRGIINSVAPYDTPWLVSDTPIKIFTTGIRTILDTLLLGQTVACLGPGFDPEYGPSYCSDTAGLKYNIYEIFSPFYFPTILPCDYTPGGIYGDGPPIGSDLIYAINYFRGFGPPPPDSCFNVHNGQWLYAAGDVNGDCRFIGSDISFLVRYFIGIQPELGWCPYTPPLDQ